MISMDDVAGGHVAAKKRPKATVLDLDPIMCHYSV